MKAFTLFLFLFISTSLLSRECDLRFPIKTFRPQFAHFSIDYYKNFKIIHVDKDHYLLSSNPILGCESSLRKFSTPVKKVVMMSTTYLPALELIHEEKSLIGFQGKQYIVSSAFDLNQIKEVAYKFNPEYLIGLKADLIMGYDANLTGLKQWQVFNSLKIPVVINKDFEEKTPLGRAEWLIFISSFYNQDEKAINIFNSIKERYLSIKNQNIKITKKTRVLVGEIQNGYWMTCSKESDLAQMIEDAGGEIGLNYPSSKTQKISLEELSQMKKVYDVWLTHNMWSSKNELEEVFKKDKRYMLIKTKNIYNNNLILNRAKFNDYWETGLQRPDLLLLDLSAVFHPESKIYKEHKIHWYRQL